MKEKLMRLIHKKKQLILYLLFGAVTTVASLFACYVTLRLGTLIWHDENGDPTAFVDILGSTSQWIVGVVVAFLTNKKWVFTEAEHGGRATLKQFGIFCGSRVGTYFVEVVINLLVIDLLYRMHYPDPALSLLGISFTLSARVWAKVVSSIVVVIANYFISKLIVFREKKEKTP